MLPWRGLGHTSHLRAGNHLRYDGRRQQCQRRREAMVRLDQVDSGRPIRARAACQEMGRRLPERPLQPALTHTTVPGSCDAW
jgi:hypothetical protein